MIDSCLECLKSLPARYAHKNPLVTVFLCTKDGERFLNKQLESFLNQTHKNISIVASDDGSVDKTVSILEGFKNQQSSIPLEIKVGPKEGVAKNFLNQIWESVNNSEFYAFSDQDDIWEKDKLERAIKYLNRVEQNVPALYCSRTRLIDKDDRAIGYSHLYTEQPSFANAIVQNIGGGNTMVMNKGAFALIQQTPNDINIVLHDWWAYMLITGVGGYVFYDEEHSVNYRQHERNQVGANQSFAARMYRIWLLITGEFRKWNNGNLKGLNELKQCLTDNNKEIYEKIINARKDGVFKRATKIYQSGVHRQTIMGNMGLIVATFLNKL